ncbi:MAG: hypothetical protein IJ312_05460 [Treponema sp.]|nr:hypothetical protein [Treponema sp.]
MILKRTLIFALISFISVSCNTNKYSSMEYTIEGDEISSYSIQEYEEINSEVEKDPTTFKEMYNSYNKANQEIRYGWTDIQSFDDIDKNLDSSKNLKKTVHYNEFKETSEFYYDDNIVEVNSITESTINGEKTEYVQDKETKAYNLGVKISGFRSVLYKIDKKIKEWKYKVANANTFDKLFKRKKNQDNY